MAYIGRFAPTPSGPLHFGSLVAALASYLDARANQGLWLLRIEDLDPPRTAAGSIDAILRCLEAFGLHWDGEPMYQSQPQRQHAYQHALDQLKQQQRVYACACSRAQFTRDANYLCTCAQQTVTSAQVAQRVISPNQVVYTDDLILPAQSQNLAREVGDFVIQRKDQLFAYQLAVVVDDAEQGISHVIRGSDLYDQTPRQVWLQQCLGYPQPTYAHIPIITNGQGQKLSKQNLAQALELNQTSALLSEALERLGQATPCDFRQASVSQQLEWAIQHWDIHAIPAQMQHPDAFV